MKTITQERGKKKMRKNICCALLVVLCATTHAQDFSIPKNRIPVRYDDFMAFVLTYDGKIKTSSLDNDKTYYWIKAKQIHQSKGGYEGDLLHGEYTALYRNDALKEKGSYYKGLKTGEWKEWHPNGELKTVSHYKKGVASGAFTYYAENGKITRKEFYRNGNLHGKQMNYTDSFEQVVRYKKGKLIKPRVKRKKEEVKVEKGEEIKEASKTTETIPSTKKNRFRKTKEEAKTENTGENTKKTEENKKVKEKKPKNEKVKTGKSER